jgi:hypothetical protein
MFLNPPWIVDKVVAAAVGQAGCVGSDLTCTVNNMRLRTGFNLSLDPANQPANFLQTVRIRGVDPKAVMPSIDQWNAGIERQLPGSIVGIVEYVGTKGTHLSILNDLNQTYFDSIGRVCFATAAGAASPNCPSLGAAGTGLVRYMAYQNLGPIEFRQNVGNSTYHGLEASMQKRFSHGLSFTAAYTWSHSIDQAMEHLYGGSSGSFLQNGHDFTQQRGPSDFDIRHRFVFSYVYDLPFGKGRTWAQEGPLSYLVGGWRASSITSFHTGRPFTIKDGNNDGAFRTGGFGGPTALADCPNGGTTATKLRDTGGSGPFWFDPSFYAVPFAQSPNPATPTAVVPRLGTCTRGTMYGPGLSNVDLAISRMFNYFGEGRSLEFRWEAFNLLNTPYFGQPSGNCGVSPPATTTAAVPSCTSNSTFGRITSLQGDPRSMQFSLRFSF